MKLQWLGENKLFEAQLNEDKIVKFEGEVFPKFGWALILMGSGGSGKGTALEKLVPINGKYINVDDLKESPKYWDIPFTWENQDGELVKQSAKDRLKNDFGVDSDKYVNIDQKTGKMEADLSDKDFVGNLHQAIRGLGKIKKNQVYNNKSADPSRLPNVIFDITNDDINDTKKVVETFKPLGYKIAIVWSLSTVNKAIKNNNKRKRNIEDEIIVDAYDKIINVARELFKSGYIENIDNFWVINTNTSDNTFKDPVKYHNEQNVFQIPCTKTGLDDFIKIYKENTNWEGKVFNVKNRMANQRQAINKRKNNL